MPGERAGDQGEGRIAGQIQPEPDIVQEHEIAHQAQLHHAFLFHDACRRPMQLIQSLLHRGVLHRKQLHGLERGVQAIEQLLALAL
ncbi:MAG: hypothetical protein P8099_11470 [Gemmatimonadota bacterium]